MYLQDIKSLETNTELELEIKEIILDNVEGYSDVEEFFDDLAANGCICGMISELLYYEDTMDFVKRHTQDINDVLTDLIGCYGVSLKELIKDFDQKDSLCLEQHNQNKIAWLVFEETCASVYRDLSYDIPLAYA